MSGAARWSSAFVALVVGVAGVTACGGSGPDRADGPGVTPPPAPIDTPQLRLLAGTFGGASFADGPALLSRFNLPSGMVIDGQGRLYVADRKNHVIRRVSPDGQVVTIAGSPQHAGAVDGPASDARFVEPSGLALDHDTLYVADSGNHAVRKLDLLLGSVTTVAGRLGQPGTQEGDGLSPAGLKEPIALAMRQGQLHIVERGNHVVRVLLAPQRLGRVAGRLGEPGDAESTQTSSAAHFRAPNGIAVDPVSSDLFIVDQGNCVLRRVSGSVVTTVAGVNGACHTVDGGPGVGQLDLSTTVVGGISFLPSGRLFVFDRSGLRELTGNGVLRTPVIADALRANKTWQPGLGAAFTTDLSGRLLVSDHRSHALYAVEFSAGPVEGSASVLAGQPVDSGTPQFDVPLGLLVALGAGRDGSLLLGNGTQGLRRITESGAVESLVPLGAGDLGVSSAVETAEGMLYAVVDQADYHPFAFLNGYRDGQLKFSVPSKNWDDLTVTQAPIGYPWALAVDPLGRAVVADSDASVVRRVDQDGNVTLVAGKPGETGYSLGTALGQARFLSPSAVAVAPDGDIFVLDYNAEGDMRLLRIAPDEGLDMVSLVADGLPAGSDIAADAVGNVYVAQSEQCIVERFRRNGERTVVAGLSGVCAFEAGALPGRLSTLNTAVFRVAARGQRLVITSDKSLVEVGPLPE